MLPQRECLTGMFLTEVPVRRYLIYDVCGCIVQIILPLIIIHLKPSLFHKDILPGCEVAL